ncbi:MAG: hypothetical protein CNC89_01805 [Puniceicoccaceae bacterium MED-G31]|nr:MAG: hypothetical protein CNC89_01805 [Puniceicoccaceae bacterium MED-G31]
MRYSIVLPANKIHASLSPSLDGHQVHYSSGKSRKVHQFAYDMNRGEIPPHSAGSYHDPEYHQQLMQRYEEYISKCTASNEEID